MVLRTLNATRYAPPAGRPAGGARLRVLTQSTELCNASAMTNTENTRPLSPLDMLGDISEREAATLHAAAIVLYGIARRHNLPESVTVAHDALSKLLHG